MYYRDDSHHKAELNARYIMSKHTVLTKCHTGNDINTLDDMHVFQSLQILFFYLSVFRNKDNLICGKRIIYFFCRLGKTKLIKDFCYKVSKLL